MSPKNSQSADRAAGTAAIWLRLAAIVVVLTMGVAGFLWAHFGAYVEAPLLKEGERVTLVIPDGTSWSGVVDRLEQSRLIENRPYFEYWARSNGLPERAKAGAYELEGPLGLEQLAERLGEGGKVEEVRMTFPEGLTIFHLGDRVEDAGLADKEAFLRAARSQALLDRAGLEADSFEGYLFPDTYRFYKGTPAEDVVWKMHVRWKEVWSEVTADHSAKIEKLKQDFGFDRHDIVTLASIVEKESSAPSERDLIARVFLNRIERDMRLQTDPTCVYGEDTYLDVPEPKHCKDKLNRYSTYVVDGLPPGPISNPGRRSMKATIDPADGEEAREYLFFVARRDGSNTHYFSKTFREHKRAIRRFLK